MMNIFRFVSNVPKEVEDTLLNNILNNDSAEKYALLLFIMIFVNYILFGLLHLILNKLSPNYQNIPFHQQRYVVKNLTKSLILLLLLLTAFKPIYDMLVYDKWNNVLAHTIGTIYVSTDLSGLLFVPKLPTDTVIHHICVIIIGTINVFMNYNFAGLHRAFVSLTILSMVPYLVNTYLGMRYLEGEIIKQLIVGFCLLIYFLSVILNCFMQHMYIFWIIPEFSASILIKKLAYLAVYYFILNDDIKLLRYLYYKWRN